MNIVYIMRGLPGSGKSTVAKKLVCQSGVIHATDDYFMVDGEYHFDKNKLREYHAANLTAFEKSLLAGVPVVVCDNTNTQHWEYSKYVEAAERCGYVVAIVVMPHPSVAEAVGRNTHSVPAYAIENMLNRWES